MNPTILSWMRGCSKRQFLEKASSGNKRLTGSFPGCEIEWNGVGKRRYSLHHDFLTLVDAAGLLVGRFRLPFYHFSTQSIGFGLVNACVILTGRQP